MYFIQYILFDRYFSRLIRFQYIHANILKYKYRNREFWCRGYNVDTVGKNAKKIEEYIKSQLEDKIGEN